MREPTPAHGPHDDPVDPAEIPQIEYADLVLRHLAVLVGPRVPLRSLRVADFVATVELEAETGGVTLPDGCLLMQPDTHTLLVERTRPVVEALLHSADGPLPDLVPLVGGSLGAVVVMDAAALGARPLSVSLARRAAAAHALAPWRSEVVSVSAVDGLECQWQLDDLRAWTSGETRTLWDDAAEGPGARGVLLFAPSGQDPAVTLDPPVPARIDGLGPVTVVRCRNDDAGMTYRKRRGLWEPEPISVDAKSWVFVA